MKEFVSSRCVYEHQDYGDKASRLHEFPLKELASDY
jgi:hypothetical protein